MDSFEINKILGAILGTCLFTLALNIGAGAIFTPEKPAKPGYDIAVAEPPAGGEAGAKPVAEDPIEKLLASSDVGKGQNSAKACQACHTFEKGGPNRVGPNLFGIVGRPKGSHPGFDYSAAMKAKGGNWTIDDLNQFLTSPRTFVPGTKMTFAGLPRGGQRADVIAYLNSLADSPAPLPKAADAAPPAPAPNAPAPNAQAPAAPNAQAPAPAPNAPGPAPAPAPNAPAPAPNAPAPAPAPNAPAPNAPAPAPAPPAKK
jgi:cytochrome c